MLRLLAKSETQQFFNFLETNQPNPIVSLYYTGNKIDEQVADLNILLFDKRCLIFLLNQIFLMTHKKWLSEF